MSTDADEVATIDVRGDGRVHVVRADITTLEVDALVNAANERLAHGGGVAAALSRAGGPAVQQESDAWVAEHGPLRHGGAAVTTAGDMPSDVIVHVVGPRYGRDQDNAGMLADTVYAALDAAAEHGARSVALPAISAGIFGYPPREATAVIAQACANWLTRRDSGVRDVWLVGYDDDTAELFANAVRHVQDIPDS
jgi:putative ATPase